MMKKRHFRNIIMSEPCSLVKAKQHEITAEKEDMEKEMATHSSILAWRIPGMGEPGGLPSMGSHRVGHD